MTQGLIPDDEGCPSSICHECGRSIVGRLSYCLACYVVFFCLSLTLGTKEVRLLLSPHVRDSLFLWAQCSSLFVAALVELDVTFTVFVAAAITMQFGFEPYGAMFSRAWKELRSKTMVEPAERTKRYLQILLMIGVFIHHMAIIVFPLFCRCYLNELGRDYLPTFLTVVCFLGIIAASTISNKVRAATDGAAVVLYVVAMVWMSTLEPIVEIWVVCASTGDLVIACQLLLWDFLTRRAKAESNENSDSAEQMDIDTIGGHSLATGRISMMSMVASSFSWHPPPPSTAGYPMESDLVRRSGSSTIPTWVPGSESGTISGLTSYPLSRLSSVKEESVREFSNCETYV